MSDEQQKSYLTISLTGRAPVRIVKDDWPIIAYAKEWDNTYECQANRTWKLSVRQHDDGRSIVYGLFTTQFQNEKNRAGGELLKQGDDIAAAIQRVAHSLGFDDLLAQKCIDDLPAEDI